MATFKDLSGAEWAIGPNLETFNRLFDTHKANLADPQQLADFYPKILVDDRLCLETIWMAVEKSSAAIAFGNFRSVMSGPVLELARAALVDALCDCWPKRAEVYRKIVRRIEDTLDGAYAEAGQLIDNLPSDLNEMQQLVNDLNAKRGKRRPT